MEQSPFPLFQPEEEVVCCGSSPAPPAAEHERPGYTLCHFVESFVESGIGPVPKVFTELDRRDLVGLLRARIGIKRDEYRIAPGLYCTGEPDGDSPVLVTANYKLSFDSLRRELSALNAWILVLDTRGVNVWCAAAHQTFGTQELVSRLHKTGLENVVSHRRLIVPQLGAAGVDALAVRKASGFEVVWGPIRAGDISGFLANSCRADAAMRLVTFNFIERVVLSPVELYLTAKPAVIALLVMWLVSGVGPGFFSTAAAWARWQLCGPIFIAGLFSGAVLVPALLPWLPFRSFYLKGIIAALPVAALMVWYYSNMSWQVLLALVLLYTSTSSYGAMNFSGATPFVSPSGVEKEMRQAIPVQLVMSLTALSLWLVKPFIG